MRRIAPVIAPAGSPINFCRSNNAEYRKYFKEKSIFFAKFIPPVRYQTRNLSATLWKGIRLFFDLGFEYRLLLICFLTGKLHWFFIPDPDHFRPFLGGRRDHLAICHFILVPPSGTEQVFPDFNEFHFVGVFLLCLSHDQQKFF